MLSPTGFDLLLNIRTKKSIDKLNKSIEIFRKSSNRLGRSMLFLTVAIAVLTILNLL